MRKGFSVRIFNGEIESFCRFQEGSFDNVMVENESFLIAMEGVILNKKSLCQEFASTNFKDLVLNLFKQKKQHFLALLEGEFSGFIIDKSEKTVFAFTNVTSTQKVFYYRSKDLIIIDTSIKNIVEDLKSNKIPFSIDVESIYQMLAFTNIIENKTPIKDIFKIYDASYIKVDAENLSIKEEQYFNVEAERFSGSKEVAINTIDEIFSKSVALEYKKDDELGKEHFSLLSGGLDSRVAVLYAEKLQLNPDKMFCFSQSNYLDETISRKIAEKFNFDYHFAPLDGGIFLKNIDKMVSISEGMVLYTGSIHVDFAMQQFYQEQFGLIHSGQIGDGVLGGFNMIPDVQKPTNKKIVVNSHFLPKVSENLKKIKSQYEREELFYLRNIAFNRAVFGGQVFQQFSYQTSPFMTKDFMSFAVSLPEKWKFNHRFYLEWIKEHCKEATLFKWERTMMKPNAHWKTTLGDHFNKRLVNVFYNKIFGKEYKISMYPYQYYFDSSPEIQSFYNDYFQSNIELLDDYKELQKDILELFHHKDFFSKSSAVNILAIFKYYLS